MAKKSADSNASEKKLHPIRRKSNRELTGIDPVLKAKIEEQAEKMYGIKYSWKIVPKAESLRRSQNEIKRVDSILKRFDNARRAKAPSKSNAPTGTPKTKGRGK